MELISYNGVEFDIVKTNLVLREPVLSEDRTTTLYTKWTIDIIAQVNPDAMSYLLNPDGTLLQFAGTRPGRTDNVIRPFLVQPRKRLIVIAGQDTILDVPQLKNPNNPNDPRLPTDAANGPFCEIWSINSIIGVTNFTVHARFTACVNDCRPEETPGGGVISPILSNRWMQSETIDDCFYPTIVTVGEAILRTDIMHFDGKNADQFRQQFFFPVPQFYQRENIEVTLSSDGSRLSYSFKDTGKLFNLGRNSPIVKADIWMNGNVKIPAGVSLTAGHTELSFGDMIQTMSAQALYNLDLTRPARAAARAVLDNLPVYSFHMHVGLWGDRNTKRTDLHRIALGVANGQLPSSFAGMLGSSEMIFRHDRANQNYVSVDVTKSWGDDTRLFNDFTQNLGVNLAGGNPAGPQQLLTNGLRLFHSLFLNENIEGRLVNDEVIDPTPGSPRPTVLSKRDNPPNSGNFRYKYNPQPSNYGTTGTMLVELVSQALQSPCQLPPKPTEQTVRFIPRERFYPDNRPLAE
jgi:hypothetical protein